MKLMLTCRTQTGRGTKKSSPLHFSQERSSGNVVATTERTQWALTRVHAIILLSIALAFPLHIACKGPEIKVWKRAIPRLRSMTGGPRHRHGARPHAGIIHRNNNATLLSTLLHVFLASCWSLPGRGNFVTRNNFELFQMASSMLSSSALLPLTTPRSSHH